MHGSPSQRRPPKKDHRRHFLGETSIDNPPEETSIDHSPKETSAGSLQDGPAKAISEDGPAKAIPRVRQQRHSHKRDQQVHSPPRAPSSQQGHFKSGQSQRRPTCQIGRRLRSLQDTRDVAFKKPKPALLTNLCCVAGCEEVLTRSHAFPIHVPGIFDENLSDKFSSQRMTSFIRSPSS